MGNKNTLIFALSINNLNLKVMSTPIVIRKHKQFALFKYISEPNPNIVLGTLVTYPKDENRIGVVIQTYDDGDFRTDMNGNTSMSEIRFSTVDDVRKYRPDLLEFLPKQALVDATIEDIKKDISMGDETAIDELLKYIPNKNLIGYLRL